MNLRLVFEEPSSGFLKLFFREFSSAVLCLFLLFLLLFIFISCISVLLLQVCKETFHATLLFGLDLQDQTIHPFVFGSSTLLLDRLHGIHTTQHNTRTSTRVPEHPHMAYTQNMHIIWISNQRGGGREEEKERGSWHEKAR